MSISPQGVFSRSAGVISSIAKQLRIFTFKPVAKVTVKFDPFETKMSHARNFLHYISAPKVLATNLYCTLKVDVACDRSEPTVTCDLISGEKVIFKLGNLDTVDVLKLYNKHVSALAPKEVEPVVLLRPKKRKKLRIKTKIPRHRR